MNASGPADRHQPGSSTRSSALPAVCRGCRESHADRLDPPTAHSGTVNYLHLFSQFAISIALVVDKKPVVGVIYAPFTSGVSSHPLDAQNGTLYSAATGFGAFLTPVDPSSFPDLVDPAYRKGRSTCAPTQYAAPLPLLRPIAPLSPEAPKGCLFAAEWGKDRRDRPDSNLTKKVNSIWNMACEIGGRQGKGGMVHGIRSLGSAALDMAYVATGAIDIFWEAGCWEWDIAYVLSRRKALSMLLSC